MAIKLPVKSGVYNVSKPRLQYETSTYPRPQSYFLNLVMSFPASERCAIAQRNQVESPLLRLPAELRNQIYAHAFGPRIIYVDKIEHCSDIYFADDALSLSVKASLCFMNTCRQIRSETESLFWQSKVWKFGPPSVDDSSVKNWLDARTTEQRNNIRHIAAHKDELDLDALWEQLPNLRGLTQLTLWGSYCRPSTDTVLTDVLPQISERVDALVGHKVELLVEEDECVTRAKLY